ncbi:UvrB/UvrC motif-containing protein, partial [Burkholderia pseudomallei]|uniref:UvrB/UvrC motif-containing protein n=1 Tax=Burkholderia pseudomallei TaxID=28450 RepID=UPI0021F6CF2D
LAEKRRAKEITRHAKHMADYASSLAFEKAAKPRDQLEVLRERVFGANVGDHVSGCE